MKYIITNRGQVILGSRCYHMELKQATQESSYVIGAGRCEIKNGRIVVSGESSGYGIKAKPGDVEYIEHALGL